MNNEQFTGCSQKQKKTKLDKVYTVSHIVVLSVMLMFFVGVAVTVYKVLFCGEPVQALLDFIEKFALPVCIAYTAKAFGENIVKIALSAIYGKKEPEAGSVPAVEDGMFGLMDGDDGSGVV